MSRERPPSRLAQLAEEGALALRRQVNDLVSLLGLPTIWRGKEPRQIAASLLDILVNLLRLDVAYIRLTDLEGPIDEHFPSEIGWEEVATIIGEANGTEPVALLLPRPNSVGSRTARLISISPLGENGSVVIGSWRANFPTQHERLLLRVASDQAALAMQSAREIRAQQRLIEEQTRSAQARDLFIGVLAHDLRGPLTAIITAAEMLRQTLPERQTRSAARIVNSAMQMNQLISDVLDFTRGNLGGGIPVTRTRVDMGAICRSCVETIETAHQRAIQLEAIGNLEGEWDSGRLSQVLLNLLGNAVAHGADPIRVTISGSSDDTVVLEVSNAGAPIPARLLPRIFEPFKRSSAGSGRRHLGLGLYIVHEIVRAHGARIEVASSEEAGTTFTVTWPRLPEAPPPASSTSGR